jgi:fructose-specific component phosphotransferase system IIB-like protein
LLLLFVILNKVIIPHENSTPALISSSRHSVHNDNAKKYSNYMADMHNLVHPAVLENLLQQNKNYLKNKPFPHMFADNIFPSSLLIAATNEIPDNPPVTSKGCVIGSSACFNDPTQHLKNAFANDQLYGPAVATLFAFLKSSTFIRFLEKLTGIQDIIPDPHFRGSGVHQTLRGGNLNIHADFNRYAQ